MDNQQLNPLPRKLQAMALEAKTNGEFLELSEIRFSVCGIPSEITNEYVFFAEGYEVEQTGVISGPPKCEKMYKCHLIAMQAVTAARICLPPEQHKK